MSLNEPICLSIFGAILAAFGWAFNWAFKKWWDGQIHAKITFENPKKSYNREPQYSKDYWPTVLVHNKGPRDFTVTKIEFQGCPKGSASAFTYPIVENTLIEANKECRWPCYVERHSKNWKIKAVVDCSDKKKGSKWSTPLIRRSFFPGLEDMENRMGEARGIYQAEMRKLIPVAQIFERQGTIMLTIDNPHGGSTADITCENIMPINDFRERLEVLKITDHLTGNEIAGTICIPPRANRYIFLTIPTVGRRGRAVHVHLRLNSGEEIDSKPVPYTE